MARNVALIPADPERIWAVLADPGSYGYWVVGSDTIRDADGGWPQPGTKIHHRVGVGPLKINDDTQVIESEPGRRLVLHARARPLGTARARRGRAGGARGVGAALPRRGPASPIAAKRSRSSGSSPPLLDETITT